MYRVQAHVQVSAIKIAKLCDIENDHFNETDSYPKKKQTLKGFVYIFIQHNPPTLKI